MFNQEGLRLRVYLDESARFVGVPLHEWIMKEAARHELAGASMVRGVEGVGCLPQGTTVGVADGAPVILELVDTTAKIERFVASIGSSVTACLMTMETVRLKICD